MKCRCQAVAKRLKLRNVSVNNVVTSGYSFHSRATSSSIKYKSHVSPSLSLADI